MELLIFLSFIFTHTRSIEIFIKNDYNTIISFIVYNLLK